MNYRLFLLTLVFVVGTADGSQLQNRTPKIDGAFSLGFSRDKRTIAFRGDKIIATLNGPYGVRQWVPTWNAYLVTGLNQVFRWRPGSEPEVILKYQGAFKKITRLDEATFAAASPDGKRLALNSNDWIGIVDLSTKKVLGETDGPRLSASLHRQILGKNDTHGVAWSPDGKWLAVTVPYPIDETTTDGTAYPLSILVNPTNMSPRLLGRGATCGWIGDDKVVLRSDRTGNRVGAAVYSTTGRLLRKTPMRYRFVTSSGPRTILLMSDTSTRIAGPDLAQKGKSIPIPNLSIQDIDLTVPPIVISHVY